MEASKLGALALGSVFILIQALSYSGYIKVDYESIQNDVENVLDVNKDGKIDEKDVDVVYKKIQDVLEHQMPAGGGFATGMLFGIRS